MPDDPMQGHPSPTWASVYEGPEPLYNEDGVDLTQIRWFLTLTPWERLESAAAHARFVEEFRHARIITPESRATTSSSS